MSIKAWAAKGPKQKLERFEYEPGPLGDEDVEVRVTHCGICHSDVAMIDNDFGISRYPLVPGHEVVGVVSAVGKNVRARKVGERVGVGWQSGSCGQCEWCARGREHLCSQEQDTIIGRPGGWAESVRAKWRFAVPIPDAIPSDLAGPLMCAGTTVFSPLLHFGVTPGMRSAVVGIGGLGHLAVQFLRKFGCEVTAISTTHNKDEEARALGATHFIATRGTDELAQARGSFDFILSTASTGVNWPDYVAALRPQGQLVIVGSPDAEVKLSVIQLLPRELAVRAGRSGSPSDTAEMLDFAARHGIRPMVNPFALDDVNAAVGFLRAGKARYRVVLAA